MVFLTVKKDAYNLRAGSAGCLDLHDLAKLVLPQRYGRDHGGYMEEEEGRPF